VRRREGGDVEDLVEPGGRAGLLDGEEVAEVDRVEGAAVDA
jgi:hypothetical protein